MATEKHGIIIRDEIPNVKLVSPLSPADLERARRIRWQWVLTFNRARSAPITHETVYAMAKCEEAIAIIDAILAAQPTVH